MHEETGQGGESEEKKGTYEFKWVMQTALRRWFFATKKHVRGEKKGTDAGERSVGHEGKKNEGCCWGESKEQGGGEEDGGVSLEFGRFAQKGR